MVSHIDFYTHFIFTGLLVGLFYEIWLIIQTPAQRVINISAEKQGFGQYNIDMIMYITGLALCVTNPISLIIVALIIISIVERSYVRMKRIIHKDQLITDWWFSYWVVEKIHSGIRFCFVLCLFYLHIILV